MGNIEHSRPPVLALSTQMRVAVTMAAPEIRGFAAMIEEEWLPEAERLEGAVEDRAVLRQMVTDIAGQIADEGMTGWADDIRDELRRLGGGQ
jgi:hypothetical protein